MSSQRTPGHIFPINDRWVSSKTGEPTSRHGSGLRYQATYVDPNGKPVSQSFSTKKAASAWLRDKVTAMGTGGYVAPSKESITLGQVEQRWRDGLTGRPSTLTTYKTLAGGHILPKWEDVPIRSIKHQDVKTWVRGLTTKKGAPVSTATARQALKLLRQIFATAMDPTDPIVTLDPTRGVKVASTSATPESVEHKFASLVDVERIAAAADYLAAQPKKPGRRTDLLLLTDAEPADDWTDVDVPMSPDGLLIRMLGATGCRFGEMAALRVGRLDIESSRPTVFITEAAVEVDGVMYVGAPKTQESVRRVPFRKAIVASLDSHLRAQGIADDDAAFVFAQLDGHPLRLRNWARRVFKPAAAMAGVDITVHGLRHSAASAAIRQGKTPVQVSRLLGHSKPSITLDVYSHEFPDDLTAIE